MSHGGRASGSGGEGRLVSFFFSLPVSNQAKSSASEEVLPFNGTSHTLKTASVEDPSCPCQLSFLLRLLGYRGP